MNSSPAAVKTRHFELPGEIPESSSVQSESHRNVTSDRVIDESIPIRASAPEVWRSLTDPILMTQWMAEPEMKLEIVTDWQIGGRVVIAGWHHARFENCGTVLRFEPHAVLAWTQLSSVSRLPDIPENHTTIEFRLMALDSGSTSLNLRVTGFPTESIYRHFDFYWRVTLPMLRRFIETGLSSPTTGAA